MHSQSEVLSERGVVSAGHADEAEAGVRALAEGGNAMDAVVAAAFTGFVVEPASCGLGGYGHLAAFLPGSGGFVTVDHGPRVPAAARADMFEIEDSAAPLYYGWPATVGRRNEWGHSSVAVPGSVAGLCAAHERFGRLPLAQVLEPAIEAAERGLDVGWSLVLFLNERLAEIRRLPAAADLLLRDGDLPRPPGWGGVRDRIDLSELAGTLRRIAREGAAGFHDGPVAEAIEREVCANGGLVTAADLRGYEPRILLEQPARYRSHEYVTAFDQVGYETFNILDRFDLAAFGPDSLAFRHVVAEAMAAAFADNSAYFGDPDVVESPVRGLSSPAFAAFRASGISLEAALPRPVAPADPWPYDEGPAPRRLPYRGTSQMAAADADGNVVSLITSLTHAFGSLVLVPGTGVLLNNSMVNFDPRPGRPNSIAPGKLPIFAAPDARCDARRRGRLRQLRLGRLPHPLGRRAQRAALVRLRHGRAGGDRRAAGALPGRADARRRAHPQLRDPGPPRSRSRGAGRARRPGRDELRAHLGGLARPGDRAPASRKRPGVVDGVRRALNAPRVGNGSRRLIPCDTWWSRTSKYTVSRGNRGPASASIQTWT